MKIFIDSANVNEIKRWQQQGVIDGVTTNPSIMLKDKVFNISEGIKQIAQLLIDRPISVEVTTNNLKEMLVQARLYSSWAKNIVIKIPVINQFGEPCLGVIKALSKEGIKVNVTGILSFNQVILAAKAGGTYLSIFAGRASDEGSDAFRLIQRSARFVHDWGYGEILVGSIRGAIDVQIAAEAGADIITVPPRFLSRMVDHQYTRETVRQFVSDAQKALMEISSFNAQQVSSFPADQLNFKEQKILRDGGNNL
jgi:transaldolase